MAHVRLKCAEDKITHLNAKLQRERDRRLRKTKELLDEQVTVQDRHESEIHRLKQEAQDAQEQLDTLRGAMSQRHADGRSPLDHDHSAPPINCPGQDQEGPSAHRDSYPTSEVIQDHRAALQKLFEWVRQEDYESAPDAVKPNREQQESESRLQDELAVTKEQLRLAEEEVLTMRRDQDQSRESLRELNSLLLSLRSEWEMCKAMLREAQDARLSNTTKLAEVIELLRLSQAESEASQSRCSQVTFLCATLQERVTELEAKVKKSTSVVAGYFNLNDPEITPVHTDSDSETHSRCPMGIGTGMFAHPIYAVS